VWDINSPGLSLSLFLSLSLSLSLSRSLALCSPLPPYRHPRLYQKIPHSPGSRVQRNIPRASSRRPYLAQCDHITASSSLSHHDSWTVPSLPTVSTACFLPLSPYLSTHALTKPLSIIAGPRHFGTLIIEKGLLRRLNKDFSFCAGKILGNKENSSGSMKNELLTV